MAIDGHNLTISVDPSEFDKLKDASGELSKALGASMQDTIDGMIFQVVDMSKKLRFSGLAKHSQHPVGMGIVPDMSLITTEQARELAEEVIKRYTPLPRASLVEVDNG